MAIVKKRIHWVRLVTFILTLYAAYRIFGGWGPVLAYGLYPYPPEAK